MSWVPGEPGVAQAALGLSGTGVPGRVLVIDVIEGRQGPELGTWLGRQPKWWKDAVTATVTDLHELFRKALAAHLPNAVAVADPFPVVGVGTRVVDGTRRRVQHTAAHIAHRRSSGTPSSRIERRKMSSASARLTGPSPQRWSWRMAALV
jgi:transposase